MNNQLNTGTTEGYTPPVGYAPPVGIVKAQRPEDMFVVAPSLENTGSIGLGDFKSYMNDYAELDRVAKEIKEKQEAIKEIVKTGLEALGMDSAKTEYGTFTLVAETHSKRFDANALKVDAPKIYDMYLVDSVKKSYMKVTPKKGKK